MKKIIVASLLAIFVFASCSKDEDSSEEILVLPIKIIEEGDISTLNYSGNKLTNVLYTNGKSVYTYNGDLIIKIDEYDSSGTLGGTHSFEYNSSNNLIKWNSVEKDNSSDWISTSTYVYNADGTITHNSSTVHGTNTYSDSNIITLINGNISKIRGINYSYDGKNNAFKNITGYSKLLDFDERTTNRNNIITTNNSTINYQYNTDNYPTKSAETQVINGFSSIYINEYFYNK